MCKKLIAFLLVGLFSIFSLVGCTNSTSNDADLQTSSSSGTTNRDNTEPTSTVETASKLERLLDHFSSEGLTVGKKSMKAAEMIGAKDGFGIEINGKEIEVYEFNLESKDENTVSNLKSAKENGEMQVLDIPFSVKMNGSLMISNYQDHPVKDKILDAFMNFK